MSYEAAVNPQAVHAGDKYVIVNTRTMRMVESHASVEKAWSESDTLNKHEMANFREAVYTVISRDETYIEGGLYGFVRDEEGGTEPANGREPDGWCLYLVKRNKLTDEFVKELHDEDFEDRDSALTQAEALFAKYGNFELEVY